MPDSVASEPIVGLLGPITVDGAPLPGLRARKLLAALALAGGRPRSAERLIDDVWGDSTPASPNPALHTQISRLRRYLGSAEIVAAGNGYRLSGAQTDLDIAQRLLAEGGADAVQEAIALWRGWPGDDLDAGSDLDDRLRQRAVEVRDLLDQARERLALESGDYTLARELAEKRCAADPLDESAHLSLMRALGASGRRTEALAVFARYRRTVVAELGLDPGVEITAYNAVLLGESRAQKQRNRPAPAERSDFVRNRRR